MNRDSLVARATTRYRDEANNVVSPETWADYVNDAYMDVVAARPDWPFMESRYESMTFAAGAAAVALQSNAWRVTSVFNATDKIPLEALDGRAQYRHDFPDPASNLGTPQYYRLRAANLEVYPRPATSTILHVDYFAPPSALGATDAPVFPEQYHRALISGALAYAYEDDGNAGQVQVHRATFDRLVSGMAADLLGPRTEKYHEILDI